MSKSKERSYFFYICALGPVFLSLLVYGYLNNYFTQVVTVHTKYGKLEGFVATSRDGKTFYQYNGVPYAKPPVGRLRFQPPLPVEPWEGVRDATRMAPSCMQYDLQVKSFRGQLDCLVLNVMTPQSPTDPVKKLLPVMVFIHGGLFMFGGSGELYGGRYFMDEDIVLVTINYRLNLFGFLNTGDDVVPGNMGLKDQLEALRFLKETIQDFGGDPNRLTIFGESAGGVSVHLHMLSPQSKGLFTNAISQSGSALCPWGFTRNPREQAIRLGNDVGCPTNSSQELVDCLNSLDPWDLMKPLEKVADLFVDTLDIFGPSVENVTSTKLKASAFLTDSPYKLTAQGKTHRVPYIAGVNSHEGCFRSAWFVGHEPHLKTLSSNWEKVASNAFFLHKNDSDTLNKLRTHHFGDNDREITASDYEALTNLVGDRLFTVPARDAALLHAKHSGAPTYLYYYKEKFADLSLGDGLASLSDVSWLPRVLQLAVNIGKKGISNRLGLQVADYGTCHGDDIIQMFSLAHTSLFDIKQGHSHYDLSRNIIKLWTTFAKTGDPGSINGLAWTKVEILNPTSTKSEKSFVPQYLLLNSKNPEMGSEPFHSRLTFWRDISLPRNLSPEEEAHFPQDVLATKDNTSL